MQRWPETKRLLGLLVNSSGRAHGRNARRLVHAARNHDRRLAAALLAAAVAHTPEGEEVLRGARMRAARKPSGVARELLRNFPKSGSRRRRRKRKGSAKGGRNGAAGRRRQGQGAGVSQRRPTRRRSSRPTNLEAEPDEPKRAERRSPTAQQRRRPRLSADGEVDLAGAQRHPLASIGRPPAGGRSRRCRRRRPRPPSQPTRLPARASRARNSARTAPSGRRPSGRAPRSSAAERRPTRGAARAGGEQRGRGPGAARRGTPPRDGDVEPDPDHRPAVGAGAATRSARPPACARRPRRRSAT